jgi:hypothetical protein
MSTQPPSKKNSKPASQDDLRIEKFIQERAELNKTLEQLLRKIKKPKK